MPLPLFGTHHLVAKRLDGSRKMPLATDVGLDPGDIVLHGDPSPRTVRNTEALPTFRPTDLARILPITRSVD